MNDFGWRDSRRVLRQKSVARLLGHRSASTISEYETGRLIPTLSTALKLCEIYKWDIKDLYPALYSNVLAELAAVNKERA